MFARIDAEINEGKEGVRTCKDARNEQTGFKKPCRVLPETLCFDGRLEGSIIAALFGFIQRLL